MTIEATPNDESIFLSEPAEQINEFGGEDYHIEESTPEERGDVVVDDEPEAGTDEGQDDDSDDAGSDSDSVADSDSDDADSDDEAGEDADEADSDDDADETDEEEEDDTDDQKPIPEKVPRKRLNKEAERRRKAEARVKELEAQLNGDPSTDTAPPVADADFTVETDAKKFQEMQDFMLDGETEKALAIYQELTNSTVKATLAHSEKQLDRQLTIREQNRELQAAGKDVVASFPELDRTGDEFDEKLAGDVVATRDFYMERRGLSPAEALRRAAKEVASDYGIEDRAAKPAAPEKPAKPAKPAAKKADVKRKMALAEKETGRLGGQSANNRSELPDINSLSEDQFDKLDPKVKAIMRGDILG